MPSWDHLKELFDEVVDLSPDERAAYLDKVCAGDPSLRAELERLVDADEQALDFMAHGPVHPSSASTDSASPVVFFPGQKVADRFRIIRLLGLGGMGQVYEAEDEVLGGFIALKTIRPEIASDQSTFERFKKEVRLAKTVTHDNVCRVFDLDHHNVPPFVTMELLEGETLSKRLRGQGKMSPAEAFPLIEQMANGLDAAHRSGIIHRDFKPGNVMITGREPVRVKVTDFGLARSMGSDVTATPGKVAGTPGYIAPELLEGAKATVASDLYALGLVIYEMVTGGRPEFERMTEPAPSPRTQVPGLDSKWEAAILRCLERNPSRRFQSALDVVNAIRDENPLSRQLAWVRQHPYAAMTVAALVLVAPLAVQETVRWLTKTQVTTEIRQITTDSGLSDYPAVTRDGKLLVYASDQGTTGNLNLYLRQIDGEGPPIQLTWHTADDYAPSFSPDGTRIVFRSERDGGGVYQVSTLGVETQLIASGGYAPSFSPDGKWIAYHVGSPGGGFLSGSSQVYVKPASGGPANALRTNLVATCWPVWAPDSKRLLVVGKPETDGDPSVWVDWWVVPLNGGAAVKTSALVPFKAKRLTPPLGQDWLTPIVWVAGENRVLFSAALGDTNNLWTVPLSAAGKVIGPAERRTLTTSADLHASVIPEPAGMSRRMLFSSLLGNVNVWSLSIDADTGKETGQMQKLTRGLSYAAAPSISADGTQLTFLAARSTTWSIRTRDLATGKEATLASADANWFRARISPDGGTVAYVDPGDHMYVVNTRTGATAKICERCGPPTDVAADGQKILFEPLDPPEDVMMIDVNTTHVTSLVRAEQPDHILYGGRYSPDGRWVALHANLDKSLNMKVFISPICEGRGLTEKDWIAVTDGSQIDGDAAWSPDGNLLYFLSHRDGFRCVWAQKLEPVTKRPVGAAFAVRHFHNPRQSLARVDRPSLVGMSVARGRLVFAMSELTGNIWMEERKRSGTAEWLTRWMPFLPR